MFIIDTPYHVTFTSYPEPPICACTGNCKKSWFKDELENQTDSCPMCASILEPATNGVHYKVIAKANRSLKISDFKKEYGLSHKEKSMIKEALQKGIEVGCISLVKPKFVSKAKAEWC